MRQGTSKPPELLELSAGTPAREVVHASRDQALSSSRGPSPTTLPGPDVAAMSRTTSRGTATVELLCETFHLSRQAYYAARKAPGRPEPRPREAPPGDHTPTPEAVEAIRRVCAAHFAGVRKVWGWPAPGQRLVVSRKRVWVLMTMSSGGPPAAHPQRRAPRHGDGADVESPMGHGSDHRLDPEGRARRRRAGHRLRDRVLLACDVTKSQQSRAILAPVERALRAVFGDAAHVPDGFELRSDHGPQYTGGDAEAPPCAWRVQHLRPRQTPDRQRRRRTRDPDPQDRVDLGAPDWASAEELRLAIEAWMQTYNAERPHQRRRGPRPQRAPRAEPVRRIRRWADLQRGEFFSVESVLTRGGQGTQRTECHSCGARAPSAMRTMTAKEMNPWYVPPTRFLAWAHASFSVMRWGSGSRRPLSTRSLCVNPRSER